MSRIASLFLGLASIFCPGCDGGNSTKASSEKDGYGSVADSLAASSDWVIDQCRVTYKGKPIPLGSAYPEIVAVFGPPDDSVIGDSGLAGRPRNYYWDKIGIEASAVVENDPAHYQLRILFREALPPPASSTNKYRRPRGTTTFGIRPYGRLDSLTQEHLLDVSFSETGTVIGAPSRFLQIPFSADSYMEINPFHGRSSGPSIIGFDFYLASPRTGPYQTYPQIHSALGDNCKLPGSR
jgi:hypothetical protein